MTKSKTITPLKGPKTLVAKVLPQPYTDKKFAIKNTESTLKEDDSYEEEDEEGESEEEEESLRVSTPSRKSS